ncbi:hypothetical protein B1H42_15055 [Enterobacter cloacae subsp. cloacae]|uniref:DUF1120 domain-containing protein n=1 Tax=Enterobacter cloacae TaxID=550 RepID=UPI0009F6C303|nr:DUF1120 domain-containing protein [Enterobacter cloacae]MBE1252909.1 DUF1120 domain-containing protein [Enterobacter cloacae]ORC19585.1 hypothetical protein B1H42_15055 [Enterobacter cloacae subsp. cloacae]ORC33454.1 hypothetical protein B2M05_02295 [Enterobacter cloacae subsp. cloacae]
MELKRNTLASLVLIASGLSLSAHAADSFNINVTGVISPAACEANITGGETIDYGTIPASTLNADAVTLLPAKQTAFTITCDAPAKLGLRTVDNRAASKMPAGSSITMDTGTPWGPSTLNGLGVDGQGNNIGGWSAELGNLTSDTVPAPDIINSINEGINWSKSPYGHLILRLHTFQTISEAGTLIPAAFSTLTGTLNVQAVINPASTLDLSQPVTLDGSVTVEMVYL